MEIIAHRGASAYALENSRAAFRLAHRQGADRVEIDVRATKDGKLVVMHDEFLDRTTTGTGRLRDFYWDELAQVRLVNGEPLLSLEEAFDTLGHDIRVYLDIKDPDIFPQIARLARGLGEAIIGSSDVQAMASVSATIPDLQRALLVGELSDPVGKAVSAGAHYAHLCWEVYQDPVSLLTPDLFERARAAGIGLILWHEEREQELKRIGKMSRHFYAVCTNLPDRARGWIEGGRLAR